MKKSWFAGAALALVVVAGDTAAQSSPIPFSLDGRIDYAAPTGDFGDAVEQGFSFGGGVSIEVVPGLGVYARFSQARFVTDLRRSAPCLTLEPRCPSSGAADNSDAVDHLMLYWSRWVGFQDAVEDSEPPITGSLMLMVQVGTDLSGDDVLAYCDEVNADDLRSAWIAYRAALSDICDGTPVAREAIHRGHAAFRHVDELRQAKGLLHRYEAERDAERDLRPGT